MSVTFLRECKKDRIGDEYVYENNNSCMYIELWIDERTEGMINAVMM